MVYPNKLSKREVFVNMKFERDFPAIVRTAIGEAGLFNPEEQAHIIAAILNRARKRRKAWGLTVRGICLKQNSEGKHQFSYWDYTKLKYLSYYYLETRIKKAVYAIREWYLDANSVNGATHYHTNGTNPDWAEGHKPCFKDSLHKFYNDIY